VWHAAWSAAAAVLSGQAIADAAGCPPAISLARFGPDSTAIRSNGIPVTWWITCDIRSPESEWLPRLAAYAGAIAAGAGLLA
jgi:hypothetical protein